jgi:hypothetical protein
MIVYFIPAVVAFLIGLACLWDDIKTKPKEVR